MNYHCTSTTCQHHIHVLLKYSNIFSVAHQQRRLWHILDESDQNSRHKRWARCAGSTYRVFLVHGRGADGDGGENHRGAVVERGQGEIHAELSCSKSLLSIYIARDILESSIL